MLMNKLIETVRFIFVSFEFLILIVIIAIALVNIDWYSRLGDEFKSNNDIWRWLPTIPLVFAIASIRMGSKILHPRENASNRVLYEWSSYWKLKFRVITSIVESCLCVVASIIIWIFTDDMSSGIVGTVYISAISVALIISLTLLLAHYKIREIMEP